MWIWQFFVLFSTTITTILEVVALAALRDPTVLKGISLSPGPYGFIFASFVPFFFDIPVSTRFKVLGARFSDKSFVYLAGLQVNYYLDCFYNFLKSGIQFDLHMTCYPCVV